MNISQIITTVRAIAEERPQHQLLDTCRYNSNPEMSGERCIFGEAFYRLGIIIPEHNNGTTIPEVLRLLNIKGTDDQYDWCDLVQAHQDRHNCWLESVQVADKKYGVLT